jgi:hypothetical protein
MWYTSSLLVNQRPTWFPNMLHKSGNHTTFHLVRLAQRIAFHDCVAMRACQMVQNIRNHHHIIRTETPAWSIYTFHQWLLSDKSSLQWWCPPKSFLFPPKCFVMKKIICCCLQDPGTPWDPDTPAASRWHFQNSKASKSHLTRNLGWRKPKFLGHLADSKRDETWINSQKMIQN